MKFYFFLIILLIIFLNFNFINSLDLILKIDINSKENYEQYECGNSLKITEKNGTLVLEESETIPPCRSIEDAGKRIRNYNFENGTNYNLTIILEFINYDWENTTLIDNVYFGELFHCGFEIRVKDAPNAIIVIDGGKSQSFNNFLSFSSNSVNSTKCDSNQSKRISLKNIKFQNWINNNNLISFYNNKIDLQILEFNSVEIENCTSFININEIKGYESPIKVILNNSKFNNIDTKQSTFISSFGNLIISNCSFNQMKVGYYLISIRGSSQIENCEFKNITMSTLKPLIYTYYGSSQINNLIISNSRFPTIYGDFVNKKVDLLGNVIKNIKLINNQIIKSSLYLSLFQINNNVENKILNSQIENITIDSSNHIESGIGFINTIGLQNYTLRLLPISNEFLNLFKIKKSIINIDGNVLDFSINSTIFCNGDENIINFNDINIKELTNDQIEFIKSNQCTKCTFKFLKSDNDNLILPPTPAPTDEVLIPTHTPIVEDSIPLSPVPTFSNQNLTNPSNKTATLKKNSTSTLCSSDPYIDCDPINEADYHKNINKMANTNSSTNNKYYLNNILLYLISLILLLK